jgi:hypothetical protein
MKSPPGRESSPAETVELHKRLKAWSREVGSGAMGLVGDLAEIHAAARQIITSIESLASLPPPTRAESGKVLVELNAWINEELVDHLGSLNASLDDVINRIYDRK